MINFFKKISNFQIFVVCFLMCNVPLFADFSNLGAKVKSELNDTAGTVMSVLNTVIASVGVVYMIIVGFIFVFKPDTFKENSKMLIGGMVALGALYGITKLGTQAFLT
ncbi:hypothetical protein DCO59_11105 [Helicobacter saguini]|uniref:hypothetical protein n=1 Tax=Helicobacter saguini TaxID=1548018 RepID=UPI00136D598C|nr:hypothetical protein [Helicobacter saguini]MWV72864.1 hypothetical protein [Helicobacter saguini]